MPCPATWLLVQMRYSHSLEIQYFMLTSMIPWRTRAKALWVWEKFLLQDSTLEAQGCSEAPGFQIWSITTAWVLIFVLLSLQCFLGPVMTARAWILNLADEQQRSTPRVIGGRESTVSRVARPSFRIGKLLQSCDQSTCLLVTSEWLWPWLLPRCVRNRYKQLIQTSSCKHLGITRAVSVSSLE